MSDIEITMEAGTQKRLLTAGKYCDRNILVTAEKQSGGIDIPTPPDDGKTRLYIRIPPNPVEGQPLLRNEPELYLTQSVSNGVTIDWGDGSDPETVPLTGEIYWNHLYAEPGDYVISMEVADGCEISLGIPGYGMGIFGFIYMPILIHAFIGSGITSIIDNAFNSCISLASVNIPENVTSIGYNAFDGCASLISVNIPETVTSIGHNAFRSCISLTSVNIPENVTNIKESTFESCCSLTSLTIPESVTSIEESAFARCCSLTSLTIPPNITHIGGGAFEYCTFVKTVYVLPVDPPEMSLGFWGNYDCIFYVPAQSVDAYKAASGWSSYADQIQAMPT